MLFLGKTISAGEAQSRFGLYTSSILSRFVKLIDREHSVNMVVPPSELIPAAIRVAQQINQNSPDSVQSTKRALLLAQSHGYESTVQAHTWSPESKRVYHGANIKVNFKP